MRAIHLRALHPDEWAAYRAMRLRALETEPGVYCALHAEAAQRSEAQWRATLAGPDRQLFGLFDADTLIGISAVFVDADDPSGETAMLAQSFIERPIAGRGPARRLYEARLAWARAHPRVRRVTVSHRASNIASMRANQHYGFRRTGAVPRTWPDGVVEDEVRYELVL
ncbi:MAG: GNAT family protein [Hyphomonadaceae bacterium]